MAVKPILTEEVLAQVNKKKKVQGKNDKNKAFLGFLKAKELISNANKVIQIYHNDNNKKLTPYHLNRERQKKMKIQRIRRSRKN